VELVVTTHLDILQIEVMVTEKQEAQAEAGGVYTVLQDLMQRAEPTGLAAAEAAEDIQLINLVVVAAQE
jgi:hypothetical protein